MIESPQLLVEARGPIEIVSFNRPTALNAPSTGLVSKFSAYVESLKDRQQVMLSHTLDHQEAMTAFVEKRSPSYEGR